MAVGSDDDSPPQPSETTTTCEDGLIWDKATEACVAPEASTNDQATLYQSLRELAWAGRYDDALRVLALLDENDKTLNYQGFIARSLGDWTAAEGFYTAALSANPDNLLARSYYGQGLTERGDLDGAKLQLREIRQRGGRQSWPEIALRLKIEGAHTGY